MMYRLIMPYSLSRLRIQSQDTVSKQSRSFPVSSIKIMGGNRCPPIYYPPLLIQTKSRPNFRGTHPSISRTIFPRLIPIFTWIRDRMKYPFLLPRLHVKSSYMTRCNPICQSTHNKNILIDHHWRCGNDVHSIRITIQSISQINTTLFSKRRNKFPGFSIYCIQDCPHSMNNPTTLFIFPVSNTTIHINTFTIPTFIEHRIRRIKNPFLFACCSVQSKQLHLWGHTVQPSVNHNRIAFHHTELTTIPGFRMVFPSYFKI